MKTDFIRHTRRLSLKVVAYFFHYEVNTGCTKVSDPVAISNI